jgi:hypothetical protein
MILPASGNDEQVIVIEHQAFKPFWSRELDEEGFEGCLEAESQY